MKPSSTLHAHDGGDRHWVMKFNSRSNIQRVSHIEDVTNCGCFTHKPAGTNSLAGSPPDPTKCALLPFACDAATNILIAVVYKDKIFNFLEKLNLLGSFF